VVGGWRGVCGADSRLPLSAARRPRRARDRPDNVPPYVRASARRGGAAPLDSTVCGGGHLTQTPAAREGTEDHKGGSQTRAAARTRSFKDKLSGRPPAAVQEIALVWWSRGRRLLRTGARVVHLLVLQAKRRWSAPAMPCHVTGHRGWVDHPGLIVTARRLPHPSPSKPIPHPTETWMGVFDRSGRPPISHPNVLWMGLWVPPRAASHTQIVPHGRFFHASLATAERVCHMIGPAHVG